MTSENYSRLPGAAGDLLSIFRRGELFAADQNTEAKVYQTGDPFPHIVIDDFFDNQALLDVVAELPSPSDFGGLFSAALPRLQEHKFAWRDLARFGPNSLRLVNYLGCKPFLDYLTALTGIEGLLPDPYLQGAGFHLVKRGGKLAVHADFNLHRQTNLYRRINVLVYLNEDWDAAWGGNLELWTTDMTRCARVVEPIFNRMVIFSTTPTSYHGHPDPLECPSQTVRKSLALYYYTAERLQAEPHATLWQSRPQESAEVTAAISDSRSS